MINITYENGEIKVETSLVSKVYNTPLKMNILNSVSGELNWSCDLNDETWASFPNMEMKDVEIRDSEDNVVILREWNLRNDGPFFYKIIYDYCNGLIKKGIIPFGVAIGTHDGEFGEWVPVVLDNKSNVLLIEASEKQFSVLCRNYKNLKNVTLLHSLITTDGKDVDFFEGGRGYTNSVKENVIRSWETEQISKSKRESIKLNDLLRNDISGKIDWLHTDVEGYDIELIMSLDVDLLPNLIIFETNNNSDSDKEMIEKYLIGLGYVIYKEPVSFLAIK